MAISDGIQPFAYARFMRPFVQENIWMNYVQDYSPEFAGGGTSVVIPTDKGARPDATGNTSYNPDDISTTFSEDATVAQSTWGAPTLSDLDTVTLTLNQARKINKLVNVLTERRLFPSIVASRAENSAREMIEAVNTHLRATLLAIQASQQRTPIAVTAANFATPNAAYKTALLNEFGNAQLAADVAFWPNDGRVAIVSPRIHKYLVDFLQEEKLFLIAENPRFVNEGMVLRYKGWDIVKDNSAGDGVANSDDDKHAIFYLRRGIGLGYAGELRDVRVFRSETYMGTLLQALWTWGAAC